MDVIAWAVERGVHVISDEIYACSIFEHSENSKGFFSAIEYVNNLAPEASVQDHDTNLKHLAQRPQDYVHVIYGLSKDFAPVVTALALFGRKTRTFTEHWTMFHISARFLGRCSTHYPWFLRMMISSTTFSGRRDSAQAI